MGNQTEHQDGVHAGSERREGRKREKREIRNPLETESQSGPAAGPTEPSLCSEVRQPFWTFPRGVLTLTLDSMNSPGNLASVLETRWQHSTAPWDGSRGRAFPPASPGCWHLLTSLGWESL